MSGGESARFGRFGRVGLVEKTRRLTRWLGGPRATLDLELTEGPICAGSVFGVRVTFVPQEGLHIRGANLELVYSETYFERTILDGYKELATARVHLSENFLGEHRAEVGVPLYGEASFRLPVETPTRLDTRPTRAAWQLRASVDIKWRPNIRRSQVLMDLTPVASGAPNVDGQTILP